MTCGSLGSGNLWQRLLGAFALTAAFVLALTAPLGAAAAPQHTEAIDQLIREGVRHDADGDYDAATATWKRLAEMAPEHPAANVHAVDTLFWLQVHENDDEGYDAEILRESAEAVRKSEVWVAAHPEDARAHFYLGQALTNLGRIHGLRARLYKAGSLAERGREHLERALALDPNLHDAKYPLGLFAYYASLVPDLFKWFNFLWFIPKGNAQDGLRYLDEVRQRGDTYRFTGAFHLANIRTYNAQEDLALALAITRDLHERHPANSLVHFELLEVLLLAREYEEVIVEAHALEKHPGTARHHRGRANAARIWRARAELYLDRPAAAWEILETFGDDGPEVPDWGSRWVAVTRGQILDTQGHRDGAMAQYRLVSARKGTNPDRSGKAALDGLESPFLLDLPPSISDPAAGGDN